MSAKLAKTFLLLLEPGRIIAFPWNPLTPVQLEDPFRDVVEEVPIMSDGDDGSRKFSEVVLEPGH